MNSNNLYVKSASLYKLLFSLILFVAIATAPISAQKNSDNNDVNNDPIANKSTMDNPQSFDSDEKSNDPILNKVTPDDKNLESDNDGATVKTSEEVTETVSLESSTAVSIQEEDRNLPLAEETEATVKAKTYQRDRSTDGIIHMDGSVRKAKKEAAVPTVPTQVQEITEGADAPRAVTPQVAKSKTYQRDRTTDGVIHMDGSVHKAKKETVPTQVQERTEGVDAPRAVTPQVVKAKTYQRDRSTSGVIKMKETTKKEKENQ